MECDFLVQNKKFFQTKLPQRVLGDILEDISYSITASLHNNKARKNEDLYDLYLENGGSDSNEDFDIKWKAGNFEIGNVRELREFKEKISRLKK